MTGRRSRVEPTEGWEQLVLLRRWPDPLAYEEIRPLTLFGASVPERARCGSCAASLPTTRSLSAASGAWRGAWRS